MDFPLCSRFAINTQVKVTITADCRFINRVAVCDVNTVLVWMTQLCLPSQLRTWAGRFWLCGLDQGSESCATKSPDARGVTRSPDQREPERQTLRPNPPKSRFTIGYQLAGNWLSLRQLDFAKIGFGISARFPHLSLSEHWRKLEPFSCASSVTY